MKSAVKLTTPPFQLMFKQGWQQGYSLIELLIAMAIGLLISAGAATLFANTVWNTRTLNTASQIQESGSYATQVLGRHIKMAGYVDWLSKADQLDYITDGANKSPYVMDASIDTDVFSEVFAGRKTIHGCVNGYSSTATTVLSSSGCTQGDASLKNAITVSYQVVSAPDPVHASTLPSTHSSKFGMTGDCNNNDTNTSTSSPQGLFAVNRFYVNANGELVCQGNGNATAPQPIISNVEQFVITYGVRQLNAANSGLLVNDMSVARK